MDHTTEALAGIRVLDLSGPTGNYCGKLFAELGADVILVEPPAGTRLRREPPFVDGVAGLERSLSFAYYNTSKRGITLNLDKIGGRNLFFKLVEDADLVIETEKPGAMKRRGLDFQALSAVNPRVIVTSITPFGQTGPYSGYESEDLVALALGGLLSLGGYADTPPMRAHGNQAWLCAGMYGAVAALMAVLEAEASGRGQHVDVSMQECVTLALENAVQYYELEGIVRKRHAGRQRFAGTGVFRCQDGFIYLMAGGVGANKFWPRSVEWLCDEGAPGAEALRDEKWSSVEFLRTEEAKNAFATIVSPYFVTRPKAYLYHEGQRRRIPIAPVSSPQDLVENRQLAHRRHFVEGTNPVTGGPMLMPGAPYRLSLSPWRMRGPAPALGQHNEEVYGRYGLRGGEIEELRMAEVL